MRSVEGKGVIDSLFDDLRLGVCKKPAKIANFLDDFRLFLFNKLLNNFFRGYGRVRAIERGVLSNDFSDLFGILLNVDALTFEVSFDVDD